MTSAITSELITDFKMRLEQHPIYAAVETLADLRCFMEHHVYSVWDFMSLIKYLQATIAPTHFPWVPQGDADVRRFINELVLEEESDETNLPGEYSSHFELYQLAMAEVGAETDTISRFIALVVAQGIDTALADPGVPKPSAQFTRQTFTFIEGDKPHEVAAALALGREHVIPGMFRAILDRFGVSADDAPIFNFYLHRHIHLDEDFHAPLSLRLLNGLCGGNAAREAEAVAAAHRAVEARLTFWDGVLNAIEHRRRESVA